MMKKKRILTLALVTAIVAVLITGATLAYFSDTDRAENRFTFGALDIEVSETLAVFDRTADDTKGAYRMATFAEWHASAWNDPDIADDNDTSYIAGLGVPAMADNAAVPFRYRIDENAYLDLYPGIKLAKDPRVDNRATSDAVMRMTIEITNAREWLVVFAKEYITDVAFLDAYTVIREALADFEPETTEGTTSLATAVATIDQVTDGWQDILNELEKKRSRS